MPWYYAPCRGTRSDAVDPVIWLPEVAREKDPFGWRHA